MKISNKSRIKPFRFKKRYDDYLEVRVRDDASAAELDAVIQALATISAFFGARLDKGDGGSGGGGKQKARPKFTLRQSILHRLRQQIVPNLPDVDPKPLTRGKL